MRSVIDLILVVTVNAHRQVRAPMGNHKLTLIMFLEDVEQGPA